MRSTRVPSGLALAWAGWITTTWGERLAIAFAIVFIAAVAASALYSSQQTISHIGQPGWICGQTLKGGLMCHRDPNFAPGQTHEPAP